MISRRLSRDVITASAVVVLTVACSDHLPTVAIPTPRSPSEIAPATLVVSDPVLQPQAAAAGASLATASTEVAYVSLPTGSLPRAIRVAIRNVTSGAAAAPPLPVVDGGFDPIPVSARADDELELTTSAADGATVLYRMLVPKRRPPRVVRTSPPHGATDIPVNSRVMVVFTEPIAPSTLTTATVSVRRGTTPVAGTVRFVTGSPFAAEFVPDEELAAGASYRLVVTSDILDTEGDALEADVSTEFTTLPSASASLYTSLAIGFAHTCALRADGTAMCWGANYSGQLGAGNDLSAIGRCAANVPPAYVFCSTVPVAVKGGRSFASLTSGTDRSCGLTSGGEAFCWGKDGWASGGEQYPTCDSSTGACSCDSSGRVCSGIPNPVAGGLTFMSVVAGYAHACGIRTGGGLYCWGAEMLAGGLGTGSAGITQLPAAVIGTGKLTSVVSGSHHICGLDAGGTAYCWGLNLAGQLGFGGGDSCQGPATSSPSWVWWCVTTPTPVSGGLRFVALTAGWQHTCGLTSAGRAYCWGDYLFAGAYGPAPRPVADNLTFVSLSSGSLSSHTCGVTTNNVAYCWGRNELGQLGDGSTNSTLAPVPVAGGLAFTAVVAGDQHSCGLTTTGVVYCWGGNDVGQLGLGTTSTGALLPTRVTGL